MIKVGSSIDIHQFEKGRDLFLCGVKIDYEYGLKGHSDADVALHAICESIIGALGLGDIGEHFPDTDPKYKGISSKVLLIQTCGLMKEKGFVLGNLDLTILCEKPYLKDYKLLMKQSVASIMKVDDTCINIKATRGEKMGFIGRGEGVVAMCTILLLKENENEL